MMKMMKMMMMVMMIGHAWVGDDVREGIGGWVGVEEMAGI